MPSTYQGATRSEVTVTDLYEEHGEPIGILERGDLLLKARLRGIEDVELLREYARVEADHQARSDVIAYINRRIRDLS